MIKTKRTGVYVVYYEKKKKSKNKNRDKSHACFEGSRNYALRKNIIIFPGSNIVLSKKKIRVDSLRQWLGRPGFNPRSSHTKDFKNGS